MKVNLTPEFIERCKKEYPDWSDLHIRLDEGWEIVGRYLCDSCDSWQDNIKISEAIENDDLETAKRLNDKRKRRCGLYNEWLKIREEQNGIE